MQYTTFQTELTQLSARLREVQDNLLWFDSLLHGDNEPSTEQLERFADQLQAVQDQARSLIALWLEGAFTTLIGMQDPTIESMNLHLTVYVNHFSAECTKVAGEALQVGDRNGAKPDPLFRLMDCVVEEIDKLRTTLLADHPTLAGALLMPYPAEVKGRYYRASIELVILELGQAPAAA